MENVNGGTSARDPQTKRYGILVSDWCVNVSVVRNRRLENIVYVTRTP
ncbi:hypothetical protein RSAG8_02495, partial [Rhizoctonia solani AG-8 WAC10335]